MSTEWWLGIWTGLGITWWVVSFVLVVSANRRGVPSRRPDSRRISVFKPLPPLAEDEFTDLRAGLESFVAALDDESELVIGCHEWNQPELQAFVEGMRQRYPRATVELVTHPNPHRFANPKVSWMRILAPHATGQLWLWSDADMEAPPHALAAMRSEFGEGDASLLTAPYVMRAPAHPARMLDALFVNVEFYPGAMLLGRLDLVRFGFGSGMLFEAAAFQRRVDWDFLGSCLAEDFHLGRLLAPARLGRTRFVTTPGCRSWREATLHYLRWQKTIRWCRPGSHAAQLIVLPILGWLAWLLVNPAQPAAWAGLLFVLAAESLTALAIFRALGSPIRGNCLFVIPVWSLARAVSWVACWFPWPIVWRERRWWSPRRRPDFRPETLEAGRRVGAD